MESYAGDNLDLLLKMLEEEELLDAILDSDDFNEELPELEAQDSNVKQVQFS